MRAARDPFAVDDARWLEALTREWPGRLISVSDDGKWHAAPAGGTGEAVIAATPGELAREMARELLAGAAADVRLLTIREAAGMLGIDRSYAARLCQRGKLGALRVGRQYRVPESAVLAYRDRPVCSRQGGSGKWVQVAGSLRELIAGLNPGDRLPGLGDLAAGHGTSVTPPGTAYRHLEAEGLVRMVPGRGFYVAGAAADGTAGDAR